VVLEFCLKVGVNTKKLHFSAFFHFFSAGGGNGIQLNFSSDEFAFCTKTYACHFCIFLEFQFYVNFESYIIAFLSIFSGS
jgi:hypothetical protein